MARIETKERKKTAPAFPAEPQAEHLWLEKFLGEWESEGEVDMGPDRGPEETTGEETVRSLGGLWVAFGCLGRDGSCRRGIDVLIRD